MVASVDEVAEEEVVPCLDVAVFFFVGVVGRAPEVEETHQVGVLAVDVAEDFYR